MCAVVNKSLRCDIVGACVQTGQWNQNAEDVIDFLNNNTTSTAPPETYILT
jgi:hypothetical protein